MAFYNGTGKKITSNEIVAIAKEFGYEEPMVRAVMEVEARGSGFYSDNTVLVLYEPHKAWIYGITFRKALAAAGIAYAKWGTKPYPKSSYPSIQKCIAIAGEEVAALSSSWGLGQTMGFNYATCGFRSAVEMVTQYAKSEANQLRGMMNYIKNNVKANDAMKKKNFRSLASAYNGKEYEKNAYHIKLERAYNKWRAYTHNLDQKFSNLLPTDPVREVLMKGDKGPEVKRLQELLAGAGFPVANMDGDFGRLTEDEVREFQKANKLTPDGKVGPSTYAKLEEIEAKQKPNNVPVGAVGDFTDFEGTPDVADNVNSPIVEYTAAPPTAGRPGNGGVIEAIAQIIAGFFKKKD